MNELRLGVKVRDIVSGFTGTTISRVEYLNGCIQYGVLPEAGADGKMPSAEYLDWQRLELVPDPKAKPVKTSRTGGPQRDAPRQ
jgi:hypothetical protein